ncbi:Vacuolar protein sorting-associated protein 4A [Bulinus truncatus]|nr:Vacuolar protein sorting-associated protein 4A [Bulinus truncatus]
MELVDLARYTDAIACLRQTLSEGSKSNNVDIQLMLSNIKHCESIIQLLISSETDAFFLNALTSLSRSLFVHSEHLTKKISQINNECISTPNLSQDRRKNLSETKSHPSVIDNFKEDNGKTEYDFESKQIKYRQSIIEATIVASGKVHFLDVVGLTEAKCSLQDSIVMPLIFPHLFTGGRKPWKRILMFGPPGTGKSHLAQAVSTEVKATFYSVSSTDLMSSWMGESEKLIKELFHHASHQHGQSVIFIDEIDSLCRRRSSREDESTRRVKTELLIQMDGADRQGQDNIFLLCATNCPWELDTAFLRRFQKRIYIPLPDFSSRIQLIKLHCKGNSVDMTESDWNQLASLTTGYSGSDLSTLTNGALFQPVRDMQVATHWQELPAVVVLHHKRYLHGGQQHSESASKDTSNSIRGDIVRRLEDFVSPKSKRFFDMVELQTGFLDADPDEWTNHEDYRRSLETVRQIPLSTTMQRGV